MADNEAIPTKIDRYVVERRLGEGGMGAVLLARDESLGRRVAIKLPHAEKLSPTARARFEREAKSAAAIRHPNVCPVFDVGEHAGRPYIAMAYIEGRSLASLVESGPLDVRRAVEIVAGIADGLAAAHAQGVVHRDVKPLNVVLDETGTPVLMDFGLARIVETEGSGPTRRGDVLGTPAYMAPEQIAGDIDEVGFRTDVYALGIVLYELLTGRLPYVGSWETIRQEIPRGKPVPLKRHRPDLDDDLVRLCRRAMSPNPAKRFATAAEFAAVAHAWLAANPEPGETVPMETADGGPSAATDARRARQPSTTRPSPRRTRGSGTAAGTAANTSAPTVVDSATAESHGRLGRRSLLLGASGLVGIPLVGLLGWQLFGGSSQEDGEDADSNAGPPAPPGDGWLPLFNGGDLTGWTEFERTSKGVRPRVGASGWRVEEGVLECVDGRDGYFLLPGIYDDLELRMECRMPPGQGITLQFRRPPLNQSNPGLPVPIVAGDPVDFAIETMGRTPKNRNEAAQLAKVLLYVKEFATIGPLLHVGNEWNELVIRIGQRSVVVEVNGRPAVDLPASRYGEFFDNVPRAGLFVLLTTGTSDGFAIRRLHLRSATS